MTLGFFWDSLFGLVFGFMLSAVAQVVVGRRAMRALLGPGVRGVVNGAAFGIVASACSYGAAAAARGFFRKGADIRSVFAFMISSTNMNVAIVILFWSLLGWKFAFAEFFGGIIIIAVVALGVTLLFKPAEIASLAAQMPPEAPRARVPECLQCGMEGDEEHAVEHEGTTYLFCGSRHENEFRANPQAVLGAHDAEEDERSFEPAALRSPQTWRTIFETAVGDVQMLRNELFTGFVVAGFAAALVPQEWLSGALRAVGAVPIVGYPLLLAVGLLLAVVTFMCSMGNVPIARFLAMAGIPLGANTTFIYGDLLVPPLVGIYRKSFPPKAVWAFLGLFVVGAMLAGAVMDAIIGNVLGGVTMGSMDLNDRFTLVSNVVVVAVVAALALFAYRGRAPVARMEH
jgi:hypothetical protein